MRELIQREIKPKVDGGNVPKLGGSVPSLRPPVPRVKRDYSSRFFKNPLKGIR